MAWSLFTYRLEVQHAGQGARPFVSAHALANQGVRKPSFRTPSRCWPGRPVIGFHSDQSAEHMRYGDLIQFEPIESVIQLLDANRPDEGLKLV